MKSFIFVIDGKFEAVISTSQRQAEKDMGKKCIAAFYSLNEAERVAALMNRDLEPQRARELHEISGALLNRVKAN